MFCDRKLLSLLPACSSDRTRPGLTNIRFSGNRATATNGHICVETTFPQDYIDGEMSPVQSNGTPFSVSPATIQQAFKLLPKKGLIQEHRGVYVAPGQVAAYTGNSASAVILDDGAEAAGHQFPDDWREMCCPKPKPEDTMLTLSRENLAVMLGLLGQDRPAITLRIPQQDNGMVRQAVQFQTVDKYDPDNTFTGIVMPYLNDRWRNDEYMPIQQADVSAMLTMLIQAMPESEQVQGLAARYGDLLPKPEASPE